MPQLQFGVLRDSAGFEIMEAALEARRDVSGREAALRVLSLIRARSALPMLRV
jgi:hypothetical protein